AVVAAGGAPDLGSALQMFRDPTETIEPDPALRALHDRQLATFTALRDAVRGRWPDLRALQTASRDHRPILETT
ncbi:MAG: hypothetical protein ACRDQ0_07565, partial [Pseudonocardia sp.]